MAVLEFFKVVVEGVEVVGIGVLFALLVPPFLELVVGSARHGKEKKKDLNEG